MKKLNFNTLYTCGDSWTAGHFISPKLQKLGVKDCNDPRNTTYRLKYAWPAYLGSKLGVNVINQGHAGASNDRIVRTVINGITELLKTHKAKDLFVLIGWSSPERKDFFYKDEKKGVRAWDTLYPAEVDHWSDDNDPIREDFYKSYVLRYWNVEEYYTRHMINNITLSSFLKSKRIKFKFFDCFYEHKRTVLSGNPDFTDFPTLSSAINKWAEQQKESGYLKHVGIDTTLELYSEIYSKHYIKPSFTDYLLDEVVANKNNYKTVKRYLHVHPTKLGHQEWAEYLAKIL